MASTYLSFTPSSTGNQRTFTFSFWVKRSKLGLGGTGQVIYCQSYGSDGYQFKIEFTSNDEFRLYNSKGASDAINLKTSKLFEDTSSWYAITIAIDTTQSTASDRAKIYVNGVQETAFGTSTYPTQNLELDVNAAAAQIIGAKYSGSYSTYFDGLLSQFIFVDGTAYAASTFGSTNSVSGEWTPNANPTVSYGSNGYKLTFEDTSALGDDTSGNTNDFTLSGSGTSTLDNPSNNFATWNTSDRWLGNTAGNGDFLDNGNTYFRTTSNSQKALVRSTIGVTSGKYYCEMKINDITRTWVGICNRQVFSTSAEWWTSNNEGGFFWYGNGPALYNANNQTSSSYGGYANGDIVMMALDMDNYAWYLGKNGTWLNSGDPTSGASKTGSVTEETYFGTTPLTNYDEVFFMAGEPSTAGNAQVLANFGNGYFGTTAVSSAGTPGSTVGTFEYNVPTGYQPMTTKGLNV